MTNHDRPVALVTGSATGVGRACVLQFAERGFDVVVNYSRSESEANATVAEVAALGAKALLCQCDVSDDTAVREMVKKIDQQYGRLDVVVNNAATTNFIPHDDLEALTEEMWDRMLAVNLKGAYFVSRAAFDLLQAGEGGAIVNVSSVAGLTGSGSCIAYAASKGALNTMTLSLARSMAPKVRVNAVCPGPIDSRWIREGNPDWDLNQMVADFPIPRAASPADVADTVLYFALGTTLTTGQLLALEGGMLLKT
ncbi:SDR family oxidoreductase [Rubripirellula sp.]|jgi:3-oxoacyl-[acyl-carrier protein] reductase|nr:SDR family oxidoreductase [Rubripirellula sp.]MDF1842737.1 SDR family NAD(P)-dependent oxidoreductase [Rubripirellula sp.]